MQSWSKEIRDMRGVLGSFAIADTGEVMAGDLSGELTSGLSEAAVSLAYMADLSSNGKKPLRIEIEADGGRIILAQRGQARLCILAHQEVNVDNALNLGLAILNREARPRSKWVDGKIRDAAFKEATSKIKILYGPAVADAKLNEALESVGATSHTRDREMVRDALYALADGPLRRILRDQAREYIEKIMRKYDLV